MSGRGFVYFIAPEAALHREEYDSLVKIGFTRGNPHDRLRNLQTGSPLRLVLWAYIDGTPELEKAFHDAFAELQSHGEWFFVLFKLWDFLRYLGEEPNIGQRVTRERLEVAVYDVLFSDVVPHPSVPEEAWKRSIDMAPLRPFFPELWEEIFG